jgi:hypothetical protein
MKSERTMKSRQTSIQITEATDRQVADLSEMGFGTQTNIVRIAVDRMHGEEVRANVRWVADYQIGDNIEAVNPRTGKIERGKIAAYAFDNTTGRKSKPTGLMVKFGDASPVEIDSQFL